MRSHPEWIVQVSSGVGPVEVRRFVFKLAARLERLCEDSGVVVCDVAFAGAESEPRSVALRIAGTLSEALRAEFGSHVLVQRSSERGRAARKRWFASVAVHEVSPAPAFGPVAKADLTITACRAGGPGGQHVNKVSTAVRVEHIPSGLCVRVASERSQKANIGHAIDRIASILAAEAEASRAHRNAHRRGLHHRVVRGNPVRTYVIARDGGLEELEKGK